MAEVVTLFRDRESLFTNQIVSNWIIEPTQTYSYLLRTKLRVIIDLFTIFYLLTFPLKILSYFLSISQVSLFVSFLILLISIYNNQFLMYVCMYLSIYLSFSFHFNLLQSVHYIRGVFNTTLILYRHLKLSKTLENSVCYCYTSYEMTEQFLFFQV